MHPDSFFDGSAETCTLARLSFRGASSRDFLSLKSPPLWRAPCLRIGLSQSHSTTPHQWNRTEMLITDLFVAASFSTWFSTAWGELTSYFSHLGTNQWIVIASSTVFFGFLCLKGNPIR